MSDKFTPLTPGSLPFCESAPIAAANGSTAAPAATPFRSFSTKPSDNAADTCAQPVVTLQRNPAGVVISIHVQCGCGRVTDLNCVY